MSSASSVTTPTITLERSRLLAGVLIAAHGGGAVVLLLILPIPVALAGGAALAAALVLGWRRHLGRRRVLRMHVREGEWLLEDGMGRRWWARVSDASTIAVIVMALAFVDARGRRRTVPVLPDSAGAEARRRLRVAARQAIAREAGTERA